jgi:hypothetical protein
MPKGDKMQSQAIIMSKKYFELSNASDMDSIYKMFSKSSTYSSQNTGLYLGADQIIEMQSKFHASFEDLHWDIHSLDEVHTNIVLLDFTLKGTKISGKKVVVPGIEYIVVYKDKIQHVEVRNK